MGLKFGHPQKMFVIQIYKQMFNIDKLLFRKFLHNN